VEQVNGPTLVALGVFFLIIGGARSFAFRAEPGEKQTGYGRGDLVGSKIFLLAGGLMFLAGVIWTVFEVVQ
jgi:hypothetical protein